jgi:hypothetical protein
VIQLRRFAHNAEDGDAVRSGGDAMIDHPIRAGVINSTIGHGRRWRDRKNTAGIDPEHERRAYVVNRLGLFASSEGILQIWQA